jgi:hypothetical protein
MSGMRITGIGAGHQGHFGRGRGVGGERKHTMKGKFRLRCAPGLGNANPLLLKNRWSFGLLLIVAARLGRAG